MTLRPLESHLCGFGDLGEVRLLQDYDSLMRMAESSVADAIVDDPMDKGFQYGFVVYGGLHFLFQEARCFDYYID